MTEPRLEISAHRSAPHLHAPDSTPRIMWTVVLSLLPPVGAGSGSSASARCSSSQPPRRRPRTSSALFGRRGTLRDGSAAITGLLLGLTLPPGFPLWMALLGGAFGIGFGKAIFGGLGQNVFNPALVGRAFLQAAFPMAITTWPQSGRRRLALRGDSSRCR
jgi:Na+-translocating ferredoxin:NAD+ oxidoreductase subunit D